MSQETTSNASTASASNSNRYHAMDKVRAIAMILGVLYHATLFKGMIGGGMPNIFGGGVTVERFTQDLLHSFRMPLFFLVSGFFSAMLFAKYGWLQYGKRRFVRVASPLVLGFFTVVPLYHLAFDYFRSAPNMGGFGVPGAGGPGIGPPMMGMDLDQLPPPPFGFVPPPLMAFDRNSDGTIDEMEWEEAKKEMKQNGSVIGPPGMRPPAVGAPANGPSAMGAPGIGPPGGMGASGMFGPPGPISSWLFGANARFFTASHLWFLWYLLVFTVITPIAFALFRVCVPMRLKAMLQRLLVVSIRLGVLPIALGLISAPLLMQTGSPFGVSLGFAAGIGRGFPDFALHLEKDMPYYAAFFVCGWLVYLGRSSLPSIGRWWLPSGVVGIALFSCVLYWSGPPMMPGVQREGSLWRTVLFFISSLGAAMTAWGFLGFFQAYFDRPSKFGRYFSDTALWIYLSHQALLAPFLWWLIPLKWPWWATSISATLLTVIASLLIFESVIRPTILVLPFGPASKQTFTYDSFKKLIWKPGVAATNVSHLPSRP